MYARCCCETHIAGSPPTVFGCLALCQKETVSSVLRGLQPQGLVSFSFSQLTNELAFIAPLLLQFLATAANVDLSESGT